MKESKILYEIVAKDAKRGKEAYEIVYDHIVAYASNLLTQKNMTDEKLNEKICSKFFNSKFDDYGCLTEEEAYTYISNVIENEIILANYMKRQDEIMFN